MNWRLPAALGLSLLLALILRLPGLDQRPFHNDEAVNAVKFGELLEDGEYSYDPDEFHGPLLAYATLAFAKTTGWTSFRESSEASFRWVPLLFGLGLIPLLWPARGALGRSGAGWAALLTALSPSLVFYNRDYIHESLLVTCTFGLMVCAWRFWCSPGWKWGVATGLAVGLMHATKETFVLNLAALILSGLCLQFRRVDSGGTRPRLKRHLVRNSLVIGGGWLVVWLVLFSSFGHNPQGLLDSFQTYRSWLSRAAGESVHVHPGWFYAQRLFWWPSGHILPWTEMGLLIFAVIGAGAAFRRHGLADARGAFVEWVALYSVILFLIYTVIPYKTPWCILGVAHGMVLLAGVGLAVAWRVAARLSQRLLLGLATLVLLLQTGWQAWTLSHGAATARANPWAYAETVPDVRNLIDRLAALTAFSPEGPDLPIQIVCEEADYWPLPYYLRAYNRVGWWSGQIPSDPAPILIVSPAMAGVPGEFGAYVNTGLFQLRHGVFRICYVSRDLWDAFLTNNDSGGS